MKVNEDEAVVGEEPNNGGPPSPLMLTLLEIGFPRSSVEMAFKTLGTSLLKIGEGHSLSSLTFVSADSLLRFKIQIDTLIVILQESRSICVVPRMMALERTVSFDPVHQLTGNETLVG